jgi:acylphosphatase
MTVHYLIRGRVQGVGYRNFVLRRAAALGLVGWARNLPDGRVEVVARGEESTLSTFENLLVHGPPHAQVVGVEKSEVSDELTVTKSFDIKY